jgi:hypothetical protein
MRQDDAPTPVRNSGADFVTRALRGAGLAWLMEQHGDAKLPTFASPSKFATMWLCRLSGRCKRPSD